MLAIPVVIVITALTVGGWRDREDVVPRNVAAANLVLSLPILVPLAALAIFARLPPATMLEWYPFSLLGGIVASLFGISIAAHPLPSVGRVLLLVAAWLLSVFAGAILAILPFAGC